MPIERTLDGDDKDLQELLESPEFGQAAEYKLAAAPDTGLGIYMYQLVSVLGACVVKDRCRINSEQTITVEKLVDTIADSIDTHKLFDIASEIMVIRMEVLMEETIAPVYAGVDKMLSMLKEANNTTDEAEKARIRNESFTKFVDMAKMYSVGIDVLLEVWMTKVGLDRLLMTKLGPHTDPNRIKHLTRQLTAMQNIITSCGVGLLGCTTAHILKLFVGQYDQFWAKLRKELSPKYLDNDALTPFWLNFPKMQLVLSQVMRPDGTEPTSSDVQAKYKPPTTCFEFDYLKSQQVQDSTWFSAKRNVSNPDTP